MVHYKKTSIGCVCVCGVYAYKYTEYFWKNTLQGLKLPYTLCILSTQNFFFQVDTFPKYHPLKKKSNSPAKCAIFHKYLLSAYLCVSITVLGAGGRMRMRYSSSPQTFIFPNNTKYSN